MESVVVYVVLGLLLAFTIVFSSTSLCARVNVWVESIFSKFNSNLAVFSSYTANIVVTGVFVVLVFLVEYIVFRRSVSESVGARMAVAFVIAMIATVFLKASLREPRPNQVHACLSGCGVIYYIIHADAYSFPSGHAARSAVISWFASRKYKWFIPIAAAYILLVSVSRIALNEHWFIDVVSGVILGFWASSLTEILYEDIVRVVRRTWISRFLRF